MRVLVVEDDRKLSALLHRGLEEAGMRVRMVARGDEGLQVATSEPFEVAVVDVMLPGLDGMQLCAGMRAAEVWTPVLLLTARGEVEDRVRGLNGGADDYVTKPFAFDELIARIHALGRRGPVRQPTTYEAGTLRMDPSALRAWRGDRELDLSTTELALLETFLRHPNQVLSRTQLLDLVWNGNDRRSNVVDVYVRYLREKIDKPFGLRSIETLRGSGYRLRADGGRPQA